MMLSKQLADALKEHIGHNVVLTDYTEGGGVLVNLAIECEDCGCVIADRDQVPGGTIENKDSAV